MLNDIIATVVAIAMSIGGAFADLANFLTPDPATPPPIFGQQQPRPTLPANIDPFHSEFTATAQAPGAVLGESTSAPAQETTVVNNYITQPVIVRAVPFPFSPVTLNDVAVLEAKINAKFSAFANPPVFPQQIAGGGVPGSYGMPPPATQRIDQLDGVTIRNATIIGGSISGTSGVGSGGGIGDNATTTTFFSTIGHFTTSIIDALSSAAATITNLGTTELIAVNATTTNLYVSGTATLGSATGVLQSTNGIVSPITNGVNGQVLKISGGVPTWAADNIGSGGSSAWATTTDNLAVYPSTASNVILIGTSATTTTGNILEVNGNSLLRGTVTAYKTVTAPSFTATSTTASQLPYASTTALTAANASTTNLTVSGVSGSLLKTDSAGNVSAAVAGVDYAAVSSSGFSTTSTDYWKTQRDFFSTTSADAFLAQRNLFSTSSTDFWKTQNNFFSTTSIGYWKSVTDLFSTTSSNYLLSTYDKGFFFSTTSADAWKVASNFFSTTSAEYWRTASSFFSTTSADFWRTQRDFFSTTSASYFLAQNQGAAFATTSSDFWLTQKNTSDLAESVNLYWTNPRFDTRLSATTSLPNVATLTNLSLPATQLTNFGVPFFSFFSATTTSALAEGNNLYFTNARADARINATSTIGTLTSAPNLGTVATSLTGFLKATAGVLSTALVDLAANVTGILPVGNGGTGWASLASGAIPYGNGTSALATTTSGAPGQILALLNGVPTWVATTTLATISGTLPAGAGGTGIGNPSAAGILLGSYGGGSWQQLATSSLSINTDNLVEGSSNFFWTNAHFDTRLAATTSLPNILTLANLSLPATQLTNFGTPFYQFFSATNTDALAQGSANRYYADNLVQSFVHSSTTIPKTYTNNTFTGSNSFTGALAFSGLNGPLDARNGTVGATSSVGVLYGGTGLTSAPTYGQLLVGNSSGGYTLTATSSLGITGGSSLFTDGGNTTYLTSSDVLGIGTTTAWSKLAVYGDIFAEGASRYLNFGTATGTTGYGLRDNGGTMEFKNANGTWQGVTTATTGPSFSVHKNGTNQTVTTGVETLLTWSTERFDTNNNFAADRFTPTVPGKYIVNLNVYCQNSTSYCQAVIYKNGSAYASGYSEDNEGAVVNANAVIDMNGTTDYLEAYGEINGTTIWGDQLYTYFTGALIAPISATAGGWTNDGTQSYLIDTTDKVGIGTTTPWSKFSIQNNYGSTLTSLFSIASSTSADGSTASTFLTVGNTGNVGIGTTSPSARVSIASAGASTGLTVQSTQSSTGGAVAIGSLNPGGRIQAFANDAIASAAVANLILQDSGGNVGIGTTSPWRKLSVTGTVGFDGLTGSTGAGSLCLDSNKQVVYNSASDACLSSTRATKHDISPLVVDALGQVLALQPVSFIYNEGDGRTRYGFIAEDTAAVDEHLATYDASSTISGIDDRSIIAVLVAAVKELANKISETAHLVIDAITARVGNFGRVHTDELCVGSTCVTPEQFAEVFGNQNAAAASASSEGDAEATGGSSAAGNPSADEASIPPNDDTATTTAGASAVENEAPDGSSTPSEPNGTDTSSTSASEDSSPPASEPEVEVQKPEAAEPATPPMEAANDNSPAEALPATGTD